MEGARQDVLDAAGRQRRLGAAAGGRGAVGDGARHGRDLAHKVRLAALLAHVLRAQRRAGRAARSSPQQPPRAARCGAARQHAALRVQLAWGRIQLRDAKVNLTLNLP